MAAALWCRDDAVVEPRRAVPAMLAALEEMPGVEVRLGTSVLGLDETASGVLAWTPQGLISADAAIVCPGADRSGVFAPLLSESIGRCRL
jgi:glycine/D-amino acid oxidase-like deaminating enzyme